MSDLLPWAPLLAVAALLWMSDKITASIHAANIDRREDHREMMELLGGIASDISDLESAVEGLARRYDPPDLSDYE